MIGLAEPLPLGRLRARNRIFFGPHETNLARRRSISDRHVAYYRRRAAGGAGLVVIEEASVHDSDWPYERAPLAASSSDGWAAVGAACHEEGALAVAAIGHAGGQGSSAYHQRALWGPSRTPDVTTREVPKEMEREDLDALVAGFAHAARDAGDAGLDGVEVNAGQWSLLRQFASGLTNQRADEYGSDRFRLLAEVLTAVRGAGFEGSVVGLRVSVDELAPWAGIVPETAAGELASLLAPSSGPLLVDYVTVVRGSAYGPGATRPDGHVPPGFGRALAAAVRKSLPRAIAVVAQGSIVDGAMAEEIVGSGEADALEMTRAQIADPDLARKVTSGDPASVRPCVLCNQLCQVHDPRNPIVSCIGEPRSGHELSDPEPVVRDPGSITESRHLLVVGGGPAGLECARVAALCGARVTLVERAARLGGMVITASRIPGRERLVLLTEWLESQCRSAGVEIALGHELVVEELDLHDGPIVCCTGSRPGRRSYEASAPGSVLPAADVLTADRLVGASGPGSAVVWDPIGGPIGVGVACLLASLGDEVALVTPDFVAGEQLARTGDLAPANVRLAQGGVSIERHCVVRSVDANGVTIEDRFTAKRSTVEHALLVVNAGHRLPDDSLYRAAERASHAAGDGADILLAGDAVAPRTIHEAVLEGRRAAMRLCASAAVDAVTAR